MLTFPIKFHDLSKETMETTWSDDEEYVQERLERHEHIKNFESIQKC